MTGPLRVIRGGSWRSYARSVRAAFRNAFPPEDRLGGLGFRLCFRAGGAAPRPTSPWAVVSLIDPRARCYRTLNSCQIDGHLVEVVCLRHEGHEGACHPRSDALSREELVLLHVHFNSDLRTAYEAGFRAGRGL